MKHARDDYNGRIVDLDNKIPEDEPVFLLRGQDSLAPRMLLMWATELRLNGGDPLMAESAERHAQLMIKWQKDHKCKTPDMYQDSPERRHAMEEIMQITEDKTGNINVSRLHELMRSYYDTDIPPILQLMDMDLKSESVIKDMFSLTIEDFEVNVSDLLKAKIVIYTNRYSKSVIITNKLK